MSNYEFDLLTTARGFGIDGKPTLRQKAVLSLIVAPVATFWDIAEFIFCTLPALLLGIDPNKPTRYEYTPKGMQEIDRREYEARVNRIKSEMWS